MRERHVPVWALVTYIEAAGGDSDRVAADYRVSTDTVRAALAYYKDHKDIVDARLETNDT